VILYIDESGDLGFDFRPLTQNLWVFRNELEITSHYQSKIVKLVN
jgi:hypothetical protein